MLFSLSNLLTGCADAPISQEWRAGDFVLVSFPEVTLAKNEYIESVEVEVQDGMIATINWIPQDWSIDLQWDNPELSLLSLSAGHFPSGLTSARDLNGFITVQTGHPTRFEIKARLLTEIASPTNPECRTNVLTQSRLILRPVSRPQNLSRMHVMSPEFMQKYIPPLPFVNQAGQYVVRKGDSLAAIAELYGLSMSELLAMNPGLKEVQPKAGQLIRVRKNEQK
ncbi:MAG: LysM peptidoglycan-binding domain-containing protein [Limisphaerales bacterium]